MQQLLGHTKVESTVRYLGIEVDAALAIAEQVDVSTTGATPGWIDPRRRDMISSSLSDR
jgi:hypothetical protein